MIELAKLRAHAKLSGYIYLNLPQFLVRQFGVSAKTHFIAFYKDGRLMLMQEEKDALVGSGPAAAK